MSGTIAVAADTRWSASGWLFDWTLGFLAAHVKDPKLAAELRQIVDENLGWLSLGDFGPKAEYDLRCLLKRNLLDEAERALPQTLENRTAALDLLQQLVDKLE